MAELWQRHDPAVLLVTHDVEEALLLADRIVVMREGRFVQDRAGDLARPREIGSAAFVQWRADLLSWLGVDSLERVVSPLVM